MHKHLKQLICTGVMAVALPLSLMATTASAATARAGHLPASHISAARHHVRPYCVIDNDGDCLQTVRGTVYVSAGLWIRSGPGQGYSKVGWMPQYASGTVYCYETGQNINGDVYWDYIDYNGTWGDVADYYLYTGGNIYQQVDPC